VLLPDYYGIIEVKQKRGNLTYEVVKKPKINPDRDCKAMLDLLWKDELLKVLEHLNIVKGLKNKTKVKQIAAIAELIDPNTTSEIVRELIKVRGNWRTEKLQIQCDDSC
jgi:hypothetical protein